VINNLVQQLNSGSQKAYQKLFDRLYPILCLFAIKFIKDKNEAEDIVQEVFIELWKQREKFNNINQIKGFLYKSIKNKCLNNIKHEKIKLEYSNEILITETEEYFEEQLIKTEVIVHIQKSVKTLPKQRKDIILMNMQGLKNNEIAEELNISVNTVKLQKKIAYKQLRKTLKDIYLLAGLFFIIH